MKVAYTLGRNDERNENQRTQKKKPYSNKNENLRTQYHHDQPPPLLCPFETAHDQANRNLQCTTLHHSRTWGKQAAVTKIL